MVEVTNELIYRQGERILRELREMRVEHKASRAEVDELRRDLAYIHEDLNDIKERLTKAHL